MRQLCDAGQHGRAIHAALDGWAALSAHNGDLSWLQKALRRYGLGADALALHVQMARRSAETHAWTELVRDVLRQGDPWWARELLEEAGWSGSRELQSLRIEAELEVGDAAPLISKWSRAHGDEVARRAAIEWWLRSGRVDEAERVLAEGPGVDVWRARFALWRNQPDAARTLLEHVAPSPETRCIEAIAAVQQGRLADAEAQLRALLDGDARAEAACWLATVLRKQGRYREAADAAETASYATAAFNLVARLERELADDYDRMARAPTDPEQARRGGSEPRRIAYLEHADALYALGLKPEDTIQAIERVLDRFAGNYTTNLTTYEGGRLMPCRMPTDPRFLGANILRVLRTRGPDAARRLYAEVAPSVDAHPLFRIYEGELELWMGEYERAERIFRGAVDDDRKVIWAWIGLGASVMLQGDLRAAQAIWREGVSVLGFEGPTLFVYRGECHRRLGELDPARRDLETAVRDRPERLSAWINLALLDGGRQAMDDAERRCVKFAPLLMEELSGRSATERLEGVLAAMRGNRRSTPVHMTYHLWGRLWHRAEGGPS